MVVARRFSRGCLQRLPRYLEWHRVPNARGCSTSALRAHHARFEVPRKPSDCLCARWYGVWTVAGITVNIIILSALTCSQELALMPFDSLPIILRVRVKRICCLQYNTDPDDSGPEMLWKSTLTLFALIIHVSALIVILKCTLFFLSNTGVKSGLFILSLTPSRVLTGVMCEASDIVLQLENLQETQRMSLLLWNRDKYGVSVKGCWHAPHCSHKWCPSQRHTPGVQRWNENWVLSDWWDHYTFNHKRKMLRSAF